MFHAEDIESLFALIYSREPLFEYGPVNPGWLYMLGCGKGGKEVFLGEDKTYEVTYRCTRCGAEDVAHFWLHTESGGPESQVSVINCWACKAGQGLSPQQMVQNDVGMFPLRAA